MTPSVSGNTATAALSSLALATAALALYSSRTPSSIQSRTTAAAVTDTLNDKDSEAEEDGQASGKKGKGRDSDADSKRFEVRKEFFDPSTSRWKEEDEGDSSNSDSDSGPESDTEGGDGKRKSFWKDKKKKKKRFLFDYIAISVLSHILTSTLRAIPSLQDLDEIFEDKPDLDARDLFLARDELGKELEKAKKVAAEWSSVDAQETETKVDGDINLGGEPKKKSKERLEAEADQLGVLIDYIDSLFKPTATKLARLLQPPSSPACSSSASQPPLHPQITFQLLWALFKPRSLAVAEHSESGQKFAFKVVSTAYSLTRDGHVFTVSGTRMIWNGDKYSRVWVDEQIPKFESLRRLTSLPVQPLSPTSPLYTDLYSRGKKYVELTGGGGMRFLRYEGVMVQVLGSGMERRVVKMRARFGRFRPDVKSYRRMNPTQAMNQWWESEDDDDDPFLYGDPSHPLAPTFDEESTSPQTVSVSDLVLLPSTIYGFSLSLREWGELLVSNFSPIAFRDDAWDRLVLDKQTKRLVKGLVECNEAVRDARRRQKSEGARADGMGEKEEKEVEVVSDIVEGKGGGLVITLHGAPGTGKTLTAEAVAETLRVPLYTVGAGSLGVLADVLEKRLRDVLDIAQYWGAALLIDEADVFLEARSLHDVARNAMVSVFLRLLEHHRGVLFLTTNRIRSIDPAFLSRFSLAITYPNLDRDKRRVIWRQFLELARVGIDADDAAFPSPAATPPPRGASKPNGSPPVSRFDSHISPSYLSKLASNSSFNGRQIKNAVRTAQALALSQGEKLGQKQIEEVVKAVEDFKRDFEEADEAGVYEAPGEGWKDSTNIFN
ncbi:AAA family ATPase [Rhodotorula toruloides]|uniref:AAA family ATPase n=1 Tax=Rhodotorula toruloides TaxID=5286 RepID=A0A511KF70_RHOTO|nr:AAA family ATPase [Rhodotorula toruloides]